MPVISSHMRDALAPLLDCARTLRDVDRTAWLAELRKESPTVVTLLEQLLRAQSPRSSAPRDR